MNNFATYPQKLRHLQKIVAYAGNSAFSQLETFVTADTEIACRGKTCGRNHQPAMAPALGGGVARQLLT